MESIVTEKSFKEELVAMLAVCFEGRLVPTDEGVELILPSGERFLVSAQRED